jgi:hypothetical protein
VGWQRPGTHLEYVRQQKGILSHFRNLLYPCFHSTHTHTHTAVLSTWRKVLTAVTPSLLTINKVMCRGHIEWSNFQSYRKKQTGQYRYFCIGNVDSF